MAQTMWQALKVLVKKFLKMLPTMIGFLFVFFVKIFRGR